MKAIENSPALWQKSLPRPRIDAHKYDRGHTAILGSDIYTGATRLAAEACSRVGSGLVTVIADQALGTFQITLPADIMVRKTPTTDLNRMNCLLAGPGGCTDEQSAAVLSPPDTVARVLDADAVRLAERLAGTGCPLVITPHDGEFARNFPEVDGQRVERAMHAAEKLDGICVLKGPNTVIAAPNGDCRINAHASPWLAKAGTGDVLAGLVAGLLAQGMTPFDAASAAVWIHGDLGQQIGPGLTPPDMLTLLPNVLKRLYAIT